jgi:hypothetical protein
MTPSIITELGLRFLILILFSNVSFSETQFYNYSIQKDAKNVNNHAKKKQGEIHEFPPALRMMK